MKVSIILPTYNEAGNIADLINEIMKVKPPLWDIEIIIVDDNSPDGTFDLVQRSFNSEPIIVPIRRTGDRGLAKSLREGSENSKGEYLIFMDADFNHEPREIPRMLDLSNDFDIIVGSRFCRNGGMEDKLHYILSLLYNRLIKLLLQLPIYDSLSGFLMIRKSVLESLNFDQIFVGYGDYTMRLLKEAHVQGARITEIPVYYQLRRHGQSKSRFFLLLFTYTWSLLKLKWLARKHTVKHPVL